MLAYSGRMPITAGRGEHAGGDRGDGLPLPLPGGSVWMAFNFPSSRVRCHSNLGGRGFYCGSAVQAWTHAAALRGSTSSPS